MRNRLLSLLSAVLLLGLLLPAFAQNEEFYWISHGDPADPVWTYFLQGAEMWADDTGNRVSPTTWNVASSRASRLTVTRSSPAAASSPA